MLDELRIRGLGVIDDATLPLGPGLTVVTGETGAGKTMVLTGLLLLFGGRADSASVRAGSPEACVDGRLCLPVGSPAASRVRDAGGDVDPVPPAGSGSADPDGGDGAGIDSDHPAQDELILRRVVSPNGRSRAYVGGAPAPISVLGELADSLLAVHGQSDQLRLARPAAQRTALDRFAGIDAGPYSTAFAAWRAAAAELAERAARGAELRRESELLSSGLAEIKRIAPNPMEDVELAELASRLGHADALTAAARAAHDTLIGDADDVATGPSDAASLLATAARTVGQHADADPSLRELGARLAELVALTADLGAEFGAYAAGVEADPAELERVESRRAALGALIRKYCDEPEPSVAGVLRWAEGARSRLASIDVSDDALARLRARRDAAAAQAVALAAELSARRRAAAAALSEAVSTELAGLAMPSARVLVEVAPRSTVGLPTLVVDGRELGATADGVDEVQILLQPHPGAPALPLGRGASGGELSRVMLALEVCLVGADPVPTLIFDEVDAGVGGRAAVEVGRRLATLAQERQVLVVTHLPQVAAFADRHVVVDKPALDKSTVAGGTGVTASDVRVVTGDARVAELARMLAGSDTPTARKHAAELLADAGTGRARADRAGTERAGTARARADRAGAARAERGPRGGDSPRPRRVDTPDLTEHGVRGKSARLPRAS
ncbi:DNA repair protein RecN [uncultured Jatrophihabitans sp.]|uniref:DNA repair protein RecN n=1 Tax=uncultured Jatrophihabitans sp. TaxID=1610747 RepID=UPI0035CBB039